MGLFKTKSTTSTDGRQIITVQFTRQGPEASEPAIKVVFEYFFPESFCVTSVNPGVLALLATIRADTHEPVSLTEEERQGVYEAASEHAGQLAKDAD